jgi:hypothetical protein
MSHPHLVAPSASDMAALKEKAHRDDVSIWSASTGTLPSHGIVKLLGTLGSALTLPDPVFGAVIDIEQLASETTSNVISSAADCHIVTAGDTTATTHTATLNAASERLTLGYLSDHHWVVIRNEGTVALGT